MSKTRGPTAVASACLGHSTQRPERRHEGQHHRPPFSVQNTRVSGLGIRVSWTLKRGATPRVSALTRRPHTTRAFSVHNTRAGCHCIRVSWTPKRRTRNTPTPPALQCPQHAGRMPRHPRVLDTQTPNPEHPHTIRTSVSTTRGSDATASACLGHPTPNTTPRPGKRPPDAPSGARRPAPPQRARTGASCSSSAPSQRAI